MVTYINLKSVISIIGYQYSFYSYTKMQASTCLMAVFMQ